MIKCAFLDLDGTIYYGEKIIDGANDVVNKFRDNKIDVFFLTNNSTKTRREIFSKLSKIGVDCKLEEIITSGYIASLYAKKQKMNNIYIFGSDGLKNEFAEQGLIMDGTDKAHNLVIGYNPKFTYEQVSVAMRVAFNAQHIIACNKERFFPGENAVIMPGCGAMVAPIEWCANREVDYVIGKPNTLMLEILCEEKGFSPEEVIMIGDTYDSDIVMANKFGCKSIYIGKNVYYDTVCVKNTRDILSIKWGELVG